ncbi:MAG: FadR/GntR family transcriptional regulator [Chloroflexota bacterium]
MGIVGSRAPVVRTDERAAQVALAALAASGGPIGCSRIATALGAAGISVSEPTAGRLLRDLERRGLVERVPGKNGRVITAQGREALAALEADHRHHQHNDEFLRAVSARSVQDVLDLFYIRRAVESEIARMAALRASDDDLDELEHAVEVYLAAMRQGASGRGEHRDVHRAIARAAQSRTSAAIVELILRDAQVYETVRRIHEAVGSTAPEDHKALLAAIRARRPDEAAAAMQAHLSRVVSALERFAQTMASDEPSAPRDSS